MNKNKIILVLTLIFFVLGVVSLILNFIYDKMLFLAIALGATATANILISVNYIIESKGKKKNKK